MCVNKKSHDLSALSILTLKLSIGSTLSFKSSLKVLLRPGKHLGDWYISLRSLVLRAAEKEYYKLASDHGGVN